MKYKGFSIETIDFTEKKIYQIYDELGYYKGQENSIKDCKQFINDYLL